MPRVVDATDVNLREAAAMLGRGVPVAFPTETVYGLGAPTHDERALQLVYELKGRPHSNPLIAHVRDADEAASLVASWDERATRLAERFWPGALTMVLARAPHVPDRATGGRATIALRAPRHPIARALLDAFGGPISAPSANRSGRISPTTAAHVASEFADQSELFILDGGASTLGIESTVVDLSTPQARLLRPGSITADEIASVIGPVERPRIAAQDASPGTSASHYAPRTPATLFRGSELSVLLRTGGSAVVLGSRGLAVPAGHRHLIMPIDAVEYAARLYAALREADDLGVARILIELPVSEGGVWDAIRDRLVRAVATA